MSANHSSNSPAGSISSSKCFVIYFGAKEFSTRFARLSFLLFVSSSIVFHADWTPGRIVYHLSDLRWNIIKVREVLSDWQRNVVRLVCLFNRLPMKVVFHFTFGCTPCLAVLTLIYSIDRRFVFRLTRRRKISIVKMKLRVCSVFQVDKSRVPASSRQEGKR